MTSRMKELRERLGYSQRDMAKLLGISQSTYSYVETQGKKKFTRFNEVLKEKCNVNPDWLNNGIGPMFLSDSYDSLVAGELQALPKATQDVIINLIHMYYEKEQSQKKEESKATD